MNRYRWTILALGTVAQASYSAVFLGIPVLAPDLRDEYGLSLTQVGVVIAAVSIGSLVTLLPWGLLTDRLGERSVLGSGLVVASLALVVAAFAPSYGVLVAMLVVAGAAGASVNAASGRAVMGWFEPSQRGFALGIRQTALPLGGAAAALCLPPIAAAGGTRAGLLVLAGACVTSALAGMIGLREAPRGEGGNSATSSTRSATRACGGSRSAAVSSASHRSASWRSPSSSSTACGGSLPWWPRGSSR